jgi:hypothetical protein
MAAGESARRDLQGAEEHRVSPVGHAARQHPPEASSIADRLGGLVTGK